MISPGAGIVKNIQNPPRAPGSGHRSHDQTPLPLPLPGAQQPESQQPEGEETVADLTCPPRPFTHCLPQPGILSRVPSWAISRRGLHNRRRGLCLCRRAKRAARQLLAESRCWPPTSSSPSPRSFPGSRFTRRRRQTADGPYEGEGGAEESALAPLAWVLVPDLRSIRSAPNTKTSVFNSTHRINVVPKFPAPATSKQLLLPSRLASPI